VSPAKCWNGFVKETMTSSIHSLYKSLFIVLPFLSQYYIMCGFGFWDFAASCVSGSSNISTYTAVTIFKVNESGDVCSLICRPHIDSRGGGVKCGAISIQWRGFVSIHRGNDFLYLLKKRDN
jgi:hypothetical protein